MVGCTATCKDNNVAKGDMVRCCICMVWFHTECVPGEATEGIWTCHKCRRMPSQMVEMSEKMTDMATELQKLTKFWGNTDKKYREDIDKLTNTNTVLVAENTKLVSELEELKEEMNSKNERVSTSPSKNLLIGGSLLRRVATKKLVDTEVKSVRNSLIADAKRTISNIANPYNNITLVVGGNDCDRATPPSAESVKQDFEGLIDMSLTKAQSVTVCGICPRVTTQEISETIASVNAELVALCEEKEQVTFVDVDPMFKLSDGSLNDGYLAEDGIHLTDKALNKIALKLNMRMKSKDGGCVTDQNSKDASSGDGGWLKVGPTRKSHTETHYNVSEQERDKSYYQRPRSYATVASTHGKSTWCYNCGESGHISSNCRFNSAIECHMCHRFGHKQKLCHLYK